MRILLDIPLQSSESLLDAGDILALIPHSFLPACDPLLIFGDGRLVGMGRLPVGLQCGTCGGKLVLVDDQLLAVGLNLLPFARERALLPGKGSAVLRELLAIRGDLRLRLGTRYRRLGVGRGSRPEQRDAGEDQGKTGRHGASIGVLLREAAEPVSTFPESPRGGNPWAIRLDDLQVAAGLRVG
ncbi:MAG TPA: hypothetical protein VGJ36_08280 [Gemmatimonadales bacterium]|jgi:hypothetical protein